MHPPAAAPWQARKCLKRVRDVRVSQTDLAAAAEARTSSQMGCHSPAAAAAARVQRAEEVAAPAEEQQEAHEAAVPGLAEVEQPTAAGEQHAATGTLSPAGQEAGPADVPTPTVMSVERMRQVRRKCTMQVPQAAMLFDAAPAARMHRRLFAPRPHHRKHRPGRLLPGCAYPPGVDIAAAAGSSSCLTAACLPCVLVLQVQAFASEVLTPAMLGSEGCMSSSRFLRVRGWGVRGEPFVAGIVHSLLHGMRQGTRLKGAQAGRCWNKGCAPHVPSPVLTPHSACSAASCPAAGDADEGVQPGGGAGRAVRPGKKRGGSRVPSAC